MNAYCNDDGLNVNARQRAQVQRLEVKVVSIRFAVYYHLVLLLMIFEID